MSTLLSFDLLYCFGKFYLSGWAVDVDGYCYRLSEGLYRTKWYEQKIVEFIKNRIKSRFKKIIWCLYFCL
jgi:hypothetical protein